MFFFAFVCGISSFFVYRHIQKSRIIKQAQVINFPTPTTKIEEYKDVFDKVITKFNSKEKVVALTFDADMTPLMKKNLLDKKVDSYYNEKIISILKEYQIPATIFISGLWAETYPDQAKKIANDQLFEIGNHSYSHPSFTKNCYNLNLVLDSEKEREISLAQEILNRITNKKIKLFRFPGGCYTKNDLQITKKYGLTVVHWNVDSRDGFNIDISKIIYSIKRDVKPGSIIVFHLSGQKNAPLTDQALPIIIDYLRKSGYQFKKISDLLNTSNPE